MEVPCDDEIMEVDPNRSLGCNYSDVISRKVQVKVRGGQVLGMVRQSHLRSDLSCRSSLCFENCPKTQKIELPSSEVTHYLIPLKDILANYLKIVEFMEINGIIFLQSVINDLLSGSASQMNSYRKIVKLIRDPRKRSIFYPNEFSKETYLPRDDKMTQDEWRIEMVINFAKYYYEHLGGQKPIVILTNDENVVKNYQNRRLEVFVLHASQYLKDFWPHLKALHEIYQEKCSVDLNAERNSQDEFEDHVKTDALELGIKSGKYIPGKLRVNKHHSEIEAFISNPKTDEDILIPGKIFRNRAVDGDIVAVELLPKSEWRSKINKLSVNNSNNDDELIWERRADVNPTGKVVGIQQRNWREYICSISDNNMEEDELENKMKRIVVVPYDRKIPKIRILTSQLKTLKNSRFVARIDNWPINSKYPNGHFVKILGSIGDLQTEIETLLLENNISVLPFSQGVLNEMPNPETWTPTEEDIEKRKDLRMSHLICSIDPKGCTDVDDALSIRKLKNGNLELGVHIADVTHFVTPDSLSDKEASRRATTVYLADRRYDMLPSALSSNVCSLLSNVDRFAVSVLWELDPNHPEKVISTWYGRTLIKSSYKLTYEQAQDIIDGKTSYDDLQIPELFMFKGKKQGYDKKIRQLADNLKLLSRVSSAIQTHRERDGALTLESTSEVQFEFGDDKSHLLEDLKPKAHLKIHETVAECMIFANHWVAKKIAKSFPQMSLLRRHPPPKRENFDELKQSAKSKGNFIGSY